MLREGDISQKEARNRFIIVFLALDTNLSTPYWQMALWMSLVGIGAGLFNSPNSSSVMNAAGVKYRGEASGIRSLTVNMGMMSRCH